MDRTISISACGMNKRQVIAIGRQMEDHYRQIIFDCSGFGVEVSSVTLVHQRSLDMAPYIVETSSTDQLTWTITNTDTAYPGYGKAELRITFTNGLAKSVVFTTMVIQSITADTTMPQPLQSWYDAMIDYIDDHSVSPEQIEEAVAEYLDEHPVQAPVQSVNGKQGAVVLTASDIGALPDSTQIPTKTSQLQNDSGFLTSAPVESVNGETGAVVLDASDVGALPDTTTASDLGAYVKPTGGIPKTDLASAVQTSLGKADTALQTAVTSFNGSTGAVTYSAPVTSVNGQTGAVSLSIPTKTSDLQNDSGFLTSAPVSSVDGKTGAVTVLPSGGKSGQVLSKASGTDYDVEWTTPQGGGGNDWTLLYDNTTTEDALLQIPVTNIDCTEIEVQIVMPTWSSNVNIYAPLMQTDGSHWNVNGYLRMLQQIPSSTSQKRYCVLRFEGVTITGHAYFCSWCAPNTGTNNLQYKYDESANMTAGMHITALSVATFANVPAGTRVLVRGR